MSNATQFAVPDHVPAELVQEINWHLAPGISENPPAVLDSLRDGRDIVYGIGARRGQDAWVLKTYDLIVEAFKAPELFSSSGFSGFGQLLGEDMTLIPVENDPPRHKNYRAILSPLFTPSRMNLLEKEISRRVRILTDAVLPLGECEFQQAIALPLPTDVFLNLVGLPIQDAPMLLKWEALLMHSIALEERAVGARAIRDYLMAAIADCEQNPRDDVLSKVINTQIDGRSLTRLEKLGLCFNLYIAGLDTVANGLGAAFKFLAENPERQRELRENPELRPRAIEEILRSQSMVVASRYVTQDVDFHGVAMKKGDFVVLPTMFGDRDGAQFPNPAAFQHDRANMMSHIAFGTGIHNCIGSHLARRELKIVVDEWLDRVPQFHIKPGARPVTYASSVVFGVESLPLAW